MHLKGIGITILLIWTILWPMVGSASVQDGVGHQDVYAFEENKGQFHENVLFRCKIPNGYLYLESDGFTYLIENQVDKAALMKELHEHNTIGPKPIFVQRAHGIKVKMVGTLDHIQISPTGQSPYYYNYFRGKDASKWVHDVRLYKKVIYSNVYAGIDLVFYSTESGQLKYDWVIHPEADANIIKLHVDGADTLRLYKDKLEIFTSNGSILDSKPVIQDLASQNFGTPYACDYILNDNIVSFQIDEQLVQGHNGYRIDPALIFSTYSGSTGDNFGFTATYDSRANLYAGGITDADTGRYPVTPGAIQTVYGGGGFGLPETGLPCDITISKYDSSGSTLLWATYLGGEQNEYPHSLVVNQDDDLFVFGTTYSENFPVTPDAYDTSYNGLADIIVARISSDGRTLMASTYIGGSSADGLNSNNSLRYNYADDFRGDIIPDELRDIYIATCTSSDDFPLVDPVDNTLSNQEGVVLQFSEDLKQLKWSTYIGGQGQDALYSIKVDVDSMVYVGGGTSSGNLNTSADAIYSSYRGKVDGFVAALDRKNHRLKKMTYWGTSEYDQVYFIDLNDDGNVFVAGQTTGNIKPTNSSYYGESNRGQYVAKLDTGLNAIEWQTSFGVRPNQIDISPSAFLVDNCEHIYMSGWGSTVRPDLNPGSTTNLETSSNAVQPTTDGNDFYLLVLDKDAQGLLYATYFGGDETDDHVDGGTSRFDKKGVVYQSVCSSCPNSFEPGHQDFPVTPNAAFTVNRSPRCSNASFKIDLQIKSDVDAYFIPTPVVGCMPVTVDFDNRSDIAEKFYWDFGDGEVDSVNLFPTHVYKEPGLYEVTLTVIDSNSCNISDTYRRTIEVLAFSKANFTYELDPCTFEASFTADVKSNNFYWDLGNGETTTEKKFNKQFEPNTENRIALYVEPNSLCADSMIEVIKTSEGPSRDIMVPNVFTPNSDALNNEYCVDGFLDGCDEFKLRIYNRWGELLYQSDTVGQCWNGNVQATQTPCPSGTYFYFIDITEAKFSNQANKVSYTISGVVTLLRE